MSNGVVLFLSGLAVAGNVALLWLTLEIGRRATSEFDNTRAEKPLLMIIGWLRSRRQAGGFTSD